MLAVNLLRLGTIRLDILTLKLMCGFPSMFIVMLLNSAPFLSNPLGMLSDVHYAIATLSMLRCYNSALCMSKSVSICVTGFFCHAHDLNV